ncbi:TPA: CBS domain-containing protein [Streptococcus suis]|nr:CBS domain-containing protein [Streptococcus suis]HEM5490914.1 CBS domain-containing protein [Streptococcus suis]
MNENRFLELFNDLDKVLRKVCQVEDGEHADVGSMLAKAKDLSPVNPVQANWDNLYVARQLRNLMVHERRTGLKEVAQPSQELISVLEKVIAQYQAPMTIETYLQKTQKLKPILFDSRDKLTRALEILDREHVSKFPIFSGKSYQGLVSDKGLANWLAKASKETGSIREKLEKASLADVLACEEDSIQVLILPTDTSLYQLINHFEGRKRTTVLVTRQAGGKIHSPEDLVGIITAQDIAEIYGMVD